METVMGSNNTNKLSPQERHTLTDDLEKVQIIQINLALKNYVCFREVFITVQIIQINLALKNQSQREEQRALVQIIQINLALKNRRPYYSIFMLYLQYILSISVIKC